MIRGRSVFEHETCPRSLDEITRLSCSQIACVPQPRDMNFNQASEYLPTLRAILVLVLERHRNANFPPLPRHSSRRKILLGSLHLFLLRLHRPLFLIPIPIRINHFLITPTATAFMRRVVFLRHVGIGIGLEILVFGLRIFVCGAAVGARGDDFFVRGVNVGVVEGGLDES